jgi:hypothetical protein
MLRILSEHAPAVTEAIDADGTASHPRGLDAMRERILER